MMFPRWFSRRTPAAVLPSTPAAPVRPKAPAPCPFGVVAAEEPPDWTDADRGALRAFFGTPAGHALRGQMNFYEQGGNRRAVLLMDEKASARAAGFHDACAWLITLSADVRPEQDEHSQLPAGVREMAERFTP